MTVRRCAAATASLLGAVWGCGASNETPATVTAVSPAMAYNDAAISVTIQGGGFRPAYRFDTMGGAANSEAAGFSAMLVPMSPASPTVSVPLEGVLWESQMKLAATIPAGMPADTYAVVVIDPRGQEARLPGASFTSLGPDEQPPTVTIETPGPRSLIGAGATIVVNIAAHDGPGTLATVTATVSPEGIAPPFSCDPPSGPCQFQFTAPEPASGTETITITAWATDSAGNSAEPATRDYPLAPRPSLTSLLPGGGPASGGTPIELRGSNFIKPTPAFDGSFLLIDGQPVDAMVIDDTTIRATTPAHDGGLAWVTVWTGGAESSQFPFQFVDTPRLRMIDPDHGPLNGGTPVVIAGNNFRGRQTHVKIDGEPLPCEHVESATRIRGVTPPGKVPGPVMVLVATDQNSGPDVLIFTYDDPVEGDADGGVDPAGCGPS